MSFLEPAFQSRIALEGKPHGVLQTWQCSYSNAMCDDVYKAEWLSSVVCVAFECISLHC